MKPILLILLLFCVLACDTDNNSEQPKKDATEKNDSAIKTTENDWTKNNLKGTIKSKEEWEYTAIIKEGYVTNGTLRQGTITDYNKEGRKTKVVVYNSKKEVDNTWNYQYDAAGNCIESVYSSKNSNNKSTATFDDKGNRIELKEYVEGELVGRTTYVYDANGRELESNAAFDEGGSHTENKCVNRYDENGNKKETVFYNEAGGINFKYFYSYDSAGNETQRAIFTGDGAPSYKYTYQYDAANRVVEKKDFDQDGSLRYKRTFKYDEKGNIVESLSFEKDNINTDYCSKFSYEYDKQGNWIVMIRYNYLDVAQEFTERKIVYYE